MRFNAMIFLLTLSCVCLTLAHVSHENCCLKYVRNIKLSTQRYIVKYTVQVRDGGCNIPAVIFIMRKGRVFCTDPREKWVEDLRLKIDNKKKPGRHPHRLRPNRG